MSSWQLLEDKITLALNRQGFKDSYGVMDIHYNLGNDLYEYVLYGEPSPVVYYKTSHIIVTFEFTSILRNMLDKGMS